MTNPEVVRECWRQERARQAEAGQSDAEKIQALMEFSTDALFDEHPRRAQITWNLVRLEITENPMGHVDAAFLALLDAHISDLEFAAMANSPLRIKSDPIS